MKPVQRNSALCEQLGYTFKQENLLQRALTHRSFAPEHNERLEFLGDSVLGCVIAKHLYSNYPQLSEGELSRFRSNLVKEETLAILAHQLGLGGCLELGEGELKSGGTCRPSILADAIEALFGAIMLDGGFAEAEGVILRLFLPYLTQVNVKSLGKDPKTLLQEHLQSKRISLPAYSIVSVGGEAHAQSFHVECYIPSLNVRTHGEGSSRRNAEQQAAQAACQQLSVSND